MRSLKILYDEDSGYIFAPDPPKANINDNNSLTLNFEGLPTADVHEVQVLYGVKVRGEDGSYHPYAVVENNTVKVNQAVMNACNTGILPISLKIVYNDGTVLVSVNCINVKVTVVPDGERELAEAFPQEIMTRSKSWEWMQNWNYDEGAIAVYNGTMYLSLVDKNKGTVPGTDTSKWSVIGAGGGGGGSSVTVDGALSSTSVNPVQNKVITEELEKKQVALESGKTIRTINGQSLLGEGDITIQGGGSVNALILDTDTGVLRIESSGSVSPVTFTITYQINGHGSQPPAVTGATAVPNPLPILSETGWIFDGWFTDAGLTTPAVPGAPLMSNITLYAKWTESEEETVLEFTANATAGSDFKGYAIGPYITERIPIGTSFKIRIETECFNSSMIYFSREDAPSYQMFKDNCPSNEDIPCYAEFNIIGLTLRVLGANITKSGPFTFKVIL